MLNRFESSCNVFSQVAWCILNIEFLVIWRSIIWNIPLLLLYLSFIFMLHPVCYTLIVILKSAKIPGSSCLLGKIIADLK